MIFIRHPFESNLKCLDFKFENVRESDVRDAIASYFEYEDFTLYYNGRKAQDAEIFPHDSTVHIAFSLPGGKGGFGSMLRAIGAQIEKTTNREACRDLSGRRLRDINEEQRLKKWISKEAEREAEKIKRRKARLERLKSKPTHKFFDFEYEKEISQLPERVNDALNEGLQKAKHSTKRSAEESASSQRPKKTWLSEEFASSSDSDSELNTSGNDSSSSKQKTSLPVDSDTSDASQPGPSCSKYSTPFESEESSQFNSDSALCADIRNEADLSGKNTRSDKSQLEKSETDSSSGNSLINNGEMNLQQENVNRDVIAVGNQAKDSESSCGNKKSRCIEEQERAEEMEIDTNEACKSEESKTSECTPKLDSKSQDDNKEFLPVELLDFSSVSAFEALGLEKLKLELMHRGLKCGGNLSDRAKRLWQVRGLQPSKYPSNLLAKKK